MIGELAQLTEPPVTYLALLNNFTTQLKIQSNRKSIRIKVFDNILPHLFPFPAINILLHAATENLHRTR